MPRFLLLQIRDADDPIRSQEVDCFARALECSCADIDTCDLILERPAQQQIDDARLVMIGGSGDYSVVEGGTWLPGALESMRQLCAAGKPTFASCWGFQAISKALGGRVVTDLSRAELGSVTLRLTDAGLADPLFAPLGATFYGQMGHQDIVDALPADAVLLASSDKVPHQAFRLSGQPIYATQFHPELDRPSLIHRVQRYPQYVSRIVGTSCEEFIASCRDTPETSQLLRRFVKQVLGT